MRRFQRHLPALSGLLILLPLLSACGGGGGGGQDVVAPTAVAPTAALSSPATGGVTDERELVLRGTADPGTGSIADLRVAGKSANTSNGFKTWSVTVPIQDGGNSFSATIEDVDGNTTVVPLGVSVVGTSPILVDPKALAYDAARKRIYLVDRQRGELLLVDPATGTRKVVSGPDLGSGPVPVGPIDLLFDEANDRVLVLDLFFAGVIEIDLKTADREILVAENSGANPTLRGGTGMAFGPGPDEVLVATAFAGLVRVDLAAAKLFPVSYDEPSLGPPLSGARGVAYDAATGTAYVTDISSKDVFAIDVDSGKRFLLSEDGVAFGPTFGFPASVELDPVHGLVVVDLVGALFAVDKGSGARTVLSSAGIGSGECFGILTDLAVADGVAYLSDSRRNLVVEVDLATGERSSFGGTFVGVGAVLEKLFDLTPSLDGRVLAPVDFNGDRGILTVDPETGTRQVVSAQGVGVGDEFGTILSVDIDPQSTELLVVDVSDRLFVVDPQSGARQVVLDSSDPDVGGIRGACWLPGSNLRALVLDDVLDRVAVFNRLTGSVTPLASGLSGASGLVVDPVGNRALVAAGDRLFAIDLDSGDATTVTRKNDSVGGGEPFDSLGALAVDPERGVAYARDDILETVLSIDLTTGQRSLVASGFVGDGLALQGNGGLSLSDDGKTLFAFHEFASAILAITIETGDRLLVSR